MTDARGARSSRSDRRALTLGGADPRDRRGGLAGQDIGGYKPPLAIDARRQLGLKVGRGLKIESGELRLDMDFVRSELGL